MNNFQDDDYHIWKIKWELAKEGNSHAIDEIKNQLTLALDQQHLLLTCNFTNLLSQSKFFMIDKDETYGGYELHSKVPTFIVLRGDVIMQCINLEGDNDIISKVQKSGLLELRQIDLRVKYGESNISLLTQFQIVGKQDKTILIEIQPKAIDTMTKNQDKQKVTMRQEVIMRKYMLISLKHITKLTFTKGTQLTGKFYLLDGRACYYNAKNKIILSCYEEGYFDPNHLSGTDYKLFIFEGSYLMFLEHEMVKDEVGSGIQIKRQEHLDNIQKRYDKMGPEERSKIQEKLISKYKLNRKEVDREIYGIIQKPVEKTMQKRVKSKNDFINTSSSIKEKCGIRIRKTKKNS